MTTLRSLVVTILVIVVVAAPAVAQSPVGALAIDERRGDQYGWAVDFETAAAAQGMALQECGSGCSVVLTFRRCAAYAADQDANSTAVGWAESYDSATGARQAALAECRSRGSGTVCIVRVWGCNGPVVEEGLGLNRAARRQIQRGLRAAGFDPGGADGQFGPRTRAAIRNWQSARGALGTGYLDGPAATALQSAAAARFQAAEAATAASPQSPSVTAAQENLFWQSIVNSTDPADFEAYLEQFPNGLFRWLAQNRLSAARRAPAASGLRGGTTANAVPAPGGATAPVAAVPTRGRLTDFGDDTSEYARDNECDDMRFDGPGMASGLTFATVAATPRIVDGSTVTVAFICLVSTSIPATSTSVTMRAVTPGMGNATILASRVAVWTNSRFVATAATTPPIVDGSTMQAAFVCSASTSGASDSAAFC